MAFDLTGTINEEEVIGVMIEKLRKSLVGANLFRIHAAPQGVSSIKIPKIDDFDTQTYTGDDLTITAAADSSVILTLSQQKAFAKTVDYVDEYEAAVAVVSEVMESGVYSIAKETDRYLLDIVGTNAGNTVPAAAITDLNVLDIIGDMGVELDNADVPDEGRVLVCSPEFAKALAQANVTFQTSSAEEATRKGFVGMYGGFEIFKSTNLKAGATTGKINVAGRPSGGDFAQSVQSFRIVETEKSFKNLIKGLSSYGAILSEPNMYVKFDDAV